MQCPRCGHQNEPNDLFCEQCGTQLNKPKPQKDELEIPSIFEEPVRYEGKYSDGYKRPKKRRKIMRQTKKWAAVALALLVLFYVYTTASQFGRVDDQMPSVIQEFRSAVAQKDVVKLQNIVVSARTLEPANPESYEGFLKVMAIPGRLDESIRNLEVDFSHLLEDRDYRSDLSIKLLKLDGDEDPVYKIGVDTFDIDVRSSGATLDGVAADADGFFRNYLMGQYMVEYGANRFPLTADSAHPNLKEGVITPARLAALEAPVPVAETEEGVAAAVQQEGAHTLHITTNLANAMLRKNGEDTNISLAEANNGYVKVDQGDRIQLIALWEGGVASSEEIVYSNQAEVDLPIEYNSEAFRQLIYDRIKAMLIEDEIAMRERNADGFTVVIGNALDTAKHVINRLYEGNQYYAGTYDWVRFDPATFTLNQDAEPMRVTVDGLMRYVYQTYNVDADPIDVDGLWREEVVMSFSLVFDETSGQWMVDDWGRTDASISDENLVQIEIR